MIAKRGKRRGHQEEGREGCEGGHMKLQPKEISSSPDRRTRAFVLRRRPLVTTTDFGSSGRLLPKQAEQRPLLSDLSLVKGKT